MEQDKRQFYREISEKNARDIKTIKITRDSNNYRGARYRSSNQDEEELTFKNKFFMQTLIVLGIVGSFYMLSRNNSALSKDILEKTRSILENNINIESLQENIEKIAEDFTLKPSVILGDENKVYIDEDELEKMKEDLEQPPKN